MGKLICKQLQHDKFGLKSAAGVLNFQNASVIPQLGTTVATGDAPLEFTKPVSLGLEFLMLAQAQECVWQRAVMGNFSSLFPRSGEIYNG